MMVKGECGGGVVGCVAADDGGGGGGGLGGDSGTSSGGVCAGVCVCGGGGVRSLMIVHRVKLRRQARAPWHAVLHEQRLLALCSVAALGRMCKSRVQCKSV
jgi:hypothetical protein